MADRGASAAVVAELVKPANQPLHLFEVHFDAVTLYITDGYRSIVWGGNTYVANGHLLNFQGVQESTQLLIPQATVTLSGVDQVWVSEVLAQNYVDRRLVIYKAFLSTIDDSVIVSPFPMFDGRMDAPSIDEDPAGKSEVTITAASQWADFERRPGRHTNNQEQQLWFAGDRFFELVSQVSKISVWGRPAASPVAQSVAPSDNVATDSGQGG